MAAHSTPFKGTSSATKVCTTSQITATYTTTTTTIITITAKSTSKLEDRLFRLNLERRSNSTSYVGYLSFPAYPGSPKG
ncbi:hypothetical protein PM082_006612 [Marasmius tenuissimus]|nr:hypothetical protein PM082_006612 [Marasmius tenuissimus]